MKDKNIYLEKGVGKLEFGQSEDDVKQILGQPDETDSMEHEDGTTSLHFMYYDLGLYLSFDSEDDFNLSDIEVDSDDFVLEDNIRVGSTKDELLVYLKRKGYTTVNVEDVSTEEEPDMELVAVDEAGVNFWLEEGEIRSIQVGPAEAC
jgi:hypothetical protein